VARSIESILARSSAAERSDRTAAPYWERWAGPASIHSARNPWHSHAVVFLLEGFQS
jgi:hypothetical protein